jgi:carboxymethylenebutenolidase
VAVVVQFRDGLASGRIYGDQASVLVQVGLINPDKLPVSGAESARKVLDPASVPSNELIARAVQGKKGTTET